MNRTCKTSKSTCNDAAVRPTAAFLRNSDAAACLRATPAGIYSLNMSSSSLLEKAKQLAPSQRLLLVEQIWDTLAHEQAAPPLSSEQARVIGQRLAKNDADPNRAQPWQTVRERIR